MSEDQKAVDAAFDEEDLPTEEPKETPSGGWTEVLGTMLGVLLLPFVGYLLWAEIMAETPAVSEPVNLQPLEREIASLKQDLGSSSEQLAALAAENEALKTQLSGLGESIESAATPDRAALLGNLPSRLSTLERNVAALKGVSSSTADNWLVAEAEYYLQLANAQLQLAGNTELAAAALREADTRLVDIANPAYTQVREAIADELTRLELANTVDVGGLSMTLASLSRVVDSLPVRRSGEDEDDADEDVVIDPDRSGPGRAWDTVKQTFSGLVEVERIGDESSPLLTPDAEILLRANLSLQLQAARLALLKGEREIFRQSMEDADAWLETYFDTESVPVQGARETIAEVSANPAMRRLPDISESLRLLRQVRTLEDSDE